MKNTTTTPSDTTTATPTITLAQAHVLERLQAVAELVDHCTELVRQGKTGEAYKAFRDFDDVGYRVSNALCWCEDVAQIFITELNNDIGKARADQNNALLKYSLEKLDDEKSPDHEQIREFLSRPIPATM